MFGSVYQWMTVPEGGCEEVNKGAETEHEPETKNVHRKSQSSS